MTTLKTLKLNAKAIDLTNKQFNFLTVLRPVEKASNGSIKWECRCVCGELTICKSPELRSGRRKSCGCMNKNSIHEKYRSEYYAYHTAKQRCNNPKTKQYNDYGGRGIEFRFSNVHEFFEHLGPKPTVAHTLDRVDNDGHYQIGNVRWATRKEQAANLRRWSNGRCSYSNSRSSDRSDEGDCKQPPT